MIPDRDPKSIGKEVTFKTDLRGLKSLKPHFRWCADQVARRLRKKAVVAEGVRVKLKTARFQLLTRQGRVTPPTTNAGELLKVALNLLSELDLNQPIRLVGLAAFNLSQSRYPAQGVLFDDPKRAKNQKLDKAIDAVLDRFGDHAVKRGCDT